MKILLCNWSHRKNISGGVENRYVYLKQVFPEAELISYADLFNDGRTVIENQIEAAKKMDEYYLKRYGEDKDILIIRDASVGGVLDTSHIPQITIFGNPYKSLSENFEFGRPYWEKMIELQKISLSYQKEKLELKNKIQLRQLELKGLLLDEELDLIKIRSEFQKIADLEAEMKMSGLKAYLTAKEILTPEQQEKLPINFPLTMPNFGRFNRVPHINKSFN